MPDKWHEKPVCTPFYWLTCGKCIRLVIPTIIFLIVFSFISRSTVDNTFPTSTPSPTSTQFSIKPSHIPSQSPYLLAPSPTINDTTTDNNTSTNAESAFCIRLELTVDTYPQEISWSLKNIQTDEIILNGPMHQLEKYETNIQQICDLERGGDGYSCYSFVVEDIYGDGLTGGDGGNIIIFVDGEQYLAFDGNTGRPFGNIERGDHLNFIIC